MGASESSAVCPWASEDESCRNGNKTTLSRLLVVLSYMRKPNQGQLTAAGVSVCGYFTSQPLTLAEIDHVIFVLHGSFADSYRLCTGKHPFTFYLPTQIIPDQPHHSDESTSAMLVSQDNCPFYSYRCKRGLSRPCFDTTLPALLCNSCLYQNKVNLSLAFT